jgi:hypothetical protein
VSTKFLFILKLTVVEGYGELGFTRGVAKRYRPTSGVCRRTGLAADDRKLAPCGKTFHIAAPLTALSCMIMSFIISLERAKMDMEGVIAESSPNRTLRAVKELGARIS